MILSLRLKFVIVITFFTIILMGAVAVLFIREKTREISQDIFVNQTSFAELISPQVLAANELYLSQKSFLLFNREMKNIFEKNVDLSNLQFANFQGELLYDAQMETEKQYDGLTRVITDGNTLKQIQSPSVSVRTQSRTIFLKKDTQGNVIAVDDNEREVSAFDPSERIVYIVAPLQNTYAVIFSVSYAHLDQRVADMTQRILLLAIFGVLIGFGLSYMFSSRIVDPIKQLNEGAQILAKGNFKYRVNVHTGDEIEMLATSFNKMAEELDSSTKVLMYKERVAKELELAAKIQKQILPKDMPKIEGLDVSAGLIPAEEVGGDLYDFIPTGDDLIMYLGDVTGHGVPSGIVVSIANALFYSFAGKSDIKDILVQANKVLKVKTSSNMFVTVCMLEWKKVEQQLNYCSAGHELILQYHAKDSSVTECKGGGIALGMIADVSKNLQTQTVASFEKGDVLLVYSDGIPEAWKNQHENYGVPRLKKVLSDYAKLPSALAIRNGILSDVKQYMGNYKQMDDMTLLVLRRV